MIKEIILAAIIVALCMTNFDARAEAVDIPEVNVQRFLLGKDIECQKVLWVGKNQFNNLTYYDVICENDGAKVIVNATVEQASVVYYIEK